MAKMKLQEKMFYVFRRSQPWIFGSAVAVSLFVTLYQFHSRNMAEFAPRSERSVITPSGETRARMVQEKCSLEERQKYEKIDRIIYHSPVRNLTMCVNLKMASSFWGYQFIQMNNPGVYSKRHFEKMTYPKFVALASGGRPRDLDIVDNSYKFMFVGEPFGRLWSIYVDKFFLPDFWPRQEGREILKINQVEGCAADITFIMFLKYIIDLYQRYKSVSRFELHWMPVSSNCNPCYFKPNFIGKLDTLNYDVEFLNLRHGLNIKDQHRNKTQDVVSLLVNEWNNGYKVSACKDKVTEEQMVLIFWKAFQYQGIIPNGVSFPVKDITTLNPITPAKIIPIFARTVSESSLSSTERETQRHTFFVNAYREIPSVIRRQIAQIYRRDFELFGYDMNPEYFLDNKR